MIYRCLVDDKIVHEEALTQGVCAGHDMVEHKPEKEIVKHVGIQIPTEGHTQPEAYDNHLGAVMRVGALQERWRYERRPIRYEFYWYTTGRLLTQMAREKLIKTALHAGLDYVIMFDDDMLLPYDFFEKMLIDMESNPNIDVLGALAFMRVPPHYPVMYTVEEGYDSINRKDYYLNRVVKQYPRNKLVECDAVGFGGVCIKMDKVREMKEPYFMSTTPTGEDIFFCANIKKQTNARIFMDTRIKLAHLGNPVIVDEDYFDKWAKDNNHSLEDLPFKYAVDEYDVAHPLLAEDKV